MKRIPFKVILFSLIGLVAVGSLVSQAPTPTSNNATNVASQACTSPGVTLVIDFGSLNKQAQSFCVSNFSGNSWKLFEAAGLKVQGTAEYPQSFVCRIQGVPSEQTEDCLGTPDFGTGTWVYFVASANTDSDTENSGWIKSGAGAAMRKPKCGDFEGWRFTQGFAETNQVPAIPATPFRCE